MIDILDEAREMASDLWISRPELVKLAPPLFSSATPEDMLQTADARLTGSSWHYAPSVSGARNVQTTWGGGAWLGAGAGGSLSAARAGNVTGVTSNAGESPGGLAGERLEPLLQVVPRARKVAFVSGDKSSVAYQQYATSMLAAGRALGMDIMIVECRSDRDYEAALAKMVEGDAEAMILGTFSLTNHEKILSLAALHKLPAIYPYLQLVHVRGRMNYDADILGLYRRVGSAYIAWILQRAKPADLPVEGPRKTELAINLNTAKALGLMVPVALSVRADEVIE